MSMQGLVARLGIDHSGFGAGLKGAGGELAAFANRVRSTASRLALPTGIAAGIGIAAATRAVNAAREQFHAESKLQSVIRATGAAAGFTSGELVSYAGSLQRVTNFGDEAIINAEALLATFKEIKGDMFKGAVESVLDLASVMDGDLKGAALQLGKALNDPLNGVTALRRAGVSFTEQQLEQIRTLQQSGDLLGAQKIVMQELQSEIGGAARAMADPVTQLEGVLGDLSQTAGGMLLPSVQAVAKGLTDAIAPSDALNARSQELGNTLLDDLIPSLSFVARVAEITGGAFHGVRGVLDGLISGAVGVVNKAVRPITWVLEKLGVMGNSFNDFMKNWQEGLELASSEDFDLAGKMFAPEQDLGTRVAEQLRKAQTEILAAQEKAKGFSAMGLGGILGSENEAAGGLSEGAKDAQRAARLFEETRTPIERLQERLREARRLFAEGIISTDVFQRSRSAIIEEATKLSDEIYKPLREAREALESDAKRMIEETRTPIEKLRAEWERAKEAFGAKLIDDETFGRKITELQKQVAELGGGESDRARRKLEGLQAGSKESLSALIAFNKEGKNDSDANKKTALNTERMKQLLIDLNRKADRQLDATDVGTIFQIPG